MATFFGSEQSVTVAEATDVRIEHVANNGDATVLNKARRCLLVKSLMARAWALKHFKHF